MTAAERQQRRRRRLRREAREAEGDAKRAESERHFRESLLREPMTADDSPHPFPERPFGATVAEELVRQVAEALSETDATIEDFRAALDRVFPPN